MPRAAPGAPSAESEAMQQRLKQLEDELKRKADPQQTVKLVELTNLKERVRQLEEANRADQQKIFDTYRKYGPASDPNTRASLNREIGGIQMQMARRGQEQKSLREEIAKLETDAGIAAQGAVEKGK
jgi:predicted  nucleic acid-binding Zn-ribbon protein